MSNEPQTPQIQDPIFCGKCGTKNLPENSFCVKCGKSLINEMPNIETSAIGSELKSKNQTTLYLIISAVIIISMIVYWNINKAPEHGKYGFYKVPELDKKQAFKISEEFVKNRLKQPNSSAFPTTYTSVQIDFDSTYTVNAYVDGLNSYGQAVRSDYQVKMKYIGGDMKDTQNWKLLDISIETN